MKTPVKVSVIMLAVILAGFISLPAQRGVRGMMDQDQPSRQGRGMDYRQGRNLGPGPDSLRMELRKQRFDSTGYRGSRQDFGPGFGPGFGRGFGPAQMPGQGRGFRGAGPVDGRMQGFLPDLTEKQIEAITELRKKQQEEMSKVMEKYAAEVKTLRYAHSEKILNLLTEDQKKSIVKDAVTRGPGNPGRNFPRR